MKTASALLKNGNVFIQGYSETTDGIWIASGQVYACNLDHIGEVSRNMRSALDGSTRGVAHPNRDEWKEIQRPMLEAVGAKSWTSLAKGAKAVGLECEDGLVTLSPSSDYEDDGGSDLPDHAITVPLESDSLGSKLIEAFSLSS